MSSVTALSELQPLTSEKLTEQLRQAIYATRQGECLPSRHLEDLYLANRAELINMPKLVTVLLGFPPLPPIGTSSPFKRINYSQRRR